MLGVTSCLLFLQTIVLVSNTFIVFSGPFEEEKVLSYIKSKSQQDIKDPIKGVATYYGIGCWGSNKVDLHKDFRSDGLMNISPLPLKETYEFKISCAKKECITETNIVPNPFMKISLDEKKPDIFRNKNNLMCIKTDYGDHVVKIKNELPVFVNILRLIGIIIFLLWGGYLVLGKIIGVYNEND